MSAAVAELPPSSVVSPVEYVKGLSPADKGAVFFALLAEARAMGEDAGTLTIDQEDGTRLGYFLTPEAWVRLRELPPSELSEAEFQRRANAGPDELLTFDQMMERLDRAAAARTQ